MKPVGKATLLEPCAFLLIKFDNKAGLIMNPGCCILPTTVPGVTPCEKVGLDVGRFDVCKPCV